MNAQDFHRAALKQMDALHRMAIHLTHCPDEAADLVQETYLRAFSSWESFEPRSVGIRPWLFQILYNVFRTSLGKEIPEPSSCNLLPAQSEMGQPLAWQELQALDEAQTCTRLKTVVGSLDPESRALLLLWSVEGLGHQEIAGVLNTSIDHVVSRLNKLCIGLSSQLSSSTASEPSASPSSAMRSVVA